MGALNSVNQPFGYKYAYYTDPKTGQTKRLLIDQIDANHNARAFPKEWSLTPPKNVKGTITEVQTPQSAAVSGIPDPDASPSGGSAEGPEAPPPQ